MNPSTWCSPVRGERRAAPQSPAPDGAAPASRASVRNVFDVATGRSQSHSDASTRRVERLVHVLLQLVDRRRRAAASGIAVDVQPLPGEPAGAERQRHRDVRLLVDAGRDLQRAAADVEARAAARPTSRTSGARRGRSARASSSPESTCSSTPVSVADPASAPPASSWRRGPPRSRTRAGRRRAACARPPCASAAASHQRVGAGLGQLAVGADLLGEAQHRLSPSTPATGGRRGGRRPRSRWTVLEPTSSTPSRMA